MDLTSFSFPTERLLLKSISDQYLDAIFSEFTPEITTYMMPRSPQKPEETAAFIDFARAELKSGNNLHCVILEKTTGEFLGGGGIHNLKSTTPEFGIWIKKSAHGNGYGQEAVRGFFDWAKSNLQFDYFIYPVDKRNLGSRKIAESLGGIIKREVRKINASGILLDEVEYWIYR